MFSYEFSRLVADEREREVQELIRIQRLLELHDVAPEKVAAQCDDGERSYSESWRASTPRASATTR